MSDQLPIRPHARTSETDEVLRRVGRNVVIFQQIESLLKRFGHSRLKSVLLATELFDVIDEPVRGGTRTVYRINDRYSLTLGSV